MLQHYRAGLNAIPLFESFRYNPDDLFLLEVAMGSYLGQLSNIDDSGAASMGFHSYPFVLDFDPRSGDYGLGFFGHTLEAASYLVQHPSMGWICYACNLWEGSSSSAVGFTLADSYHIRSYLEPLGVYLEAQAGNLESIFVNLTARSSTIVFAPALDSPASVAKHSNRPFSYLRLLVSKNLSPSVHRPGQNFKISADGSVCPQVRGAFQIKPNSDDKVPTVVTLSWDP